MFISRAEKNLLKKQIQILTDRADALETAIGLLGTDLHTHLIKKEFEAADKKPKRRGPAWTPEQRAAASERMKKMHAEGKYK